MALPETFRDTVVGDDPGFVAAGPRGDLHLRPESACLGAGWNGVSPRPAHEYRHPMRGAARGDTEALSIGAFGAGV
jgi:hypothetical protein